MNSDNPCTFIYTSGTTSKPKAVVHTHNSIGSNITMLNDAWNWNSDDYILNVLPMHHIHGLINITLCALSNGARITFDKFDAINTWNLFNTLDLTVFMAVPTVYAKLIKAFNDMSESDKLVYKNCLSKFRLMVSGSAALPDKIMNDWHDISGHILLERYGMTEMCMSISSPYNGTRKIKSVGTPLPGVETKITEENELLVKSPSMFKEYYNKPEKTKSEFTQDGWFITGDIAEIDDDGYYYIKGRKSADIHKVAGYKISSLDIEYAYLQNEMISEIIVFGVPDDDSGEMLVALIVLKPEYKDKMEDELITALKKFGKETLAYYKIPKKMYFVDEIPKNVMGKVNKKELSKSFVINNAM